jgi:uncharacterized protein (TIGR02145 family)
MERILKNLLNILFVLACFLILLSCSENSNDSSRYSAWHGETVTFFNQVWMLSNLDVDHYRNGDPIPQVTDPDEWSKLTTGAWCYYNNDPENDKIYGKLYNWYAVNDPRGLAPVGWHIPSLEEWRQLELILGMSRDEVGLITMVRGSNEGSKLAGNFDLWEDGDLRNNNKFGRSGFNALPGGGRNDYDGLFSNIGSSCVFWSSSERDSTKAFFRALNFKSSNIFASYNDKKFGVSVRCIKDHSFEIDNHFRK